MTKAKLSRLNSLNLEIEQEKRRLSELRAAAESCTAPISGLPHVAGSIRRSEDVQITLAEQEALLREKVRESVREYDRLNRFIFSVDDPQVRQILRLRFVDGLPWVQVALQTGNTEDSARKICARFLESQAQ